jgi:two-component system, sensor histidine kinase YesM
MKILAKKITLTMMNLGLRFRLGLSLSLISLVPLLGLGFFSYYQTANTIQDIVSKYTNGIINEININIFLNFKNIDDISKVLLNNTAIKEILSKDGAESSRDFFIDHVKVSSILKSIKFSNDYITSIYILPEKNNNIYGVGEVTGVYGVSLLTNEYKANYKESALYRDTIAEYNNYKWWPPQNMLGQNVFILTRKIYDVDLGALGVIVIHVSDKILNNIYQRLDNRKDTRMFLMDDQGMVLFDPDSNRVGKQLKSPEILKRVGLNESGGFVTQKEKHQNFVVYNTFFVTGWKLVVLTPYRKLIAEASKIRNVTLVIALGCLFLVLVLSFFITRGILDPIDKLSQLMKKGATGDMKVRFNVLYQDEIGVLGDSFNKMMSDIEQLMLMVEAEQKQKVEAEINALEAHINPHFLYNTLASIYWMAMAEGNIRLGKMAAALSNFFRLGLNKGKEFTTIEKEAEHVKNYLSIQKMRFEEKFVFEIQVEEGILSCQTIKLILQPLVENSLIHGIEKQAGTGMIRISVFQKENRIVFRVMDNGVGIPNLRETGLPWIISHGYGLKNVCERLKLYFDNDYTIDCTSIANQETIFEISIPAITSRKEGENAQSSDCG